MARISKRLVDAASPRDKAYFEWDTTLPGFGLRVLPSGAKAFIYQYRTAEGRTRRATVAKVGAVTPDRARELAEGMSALVKAGGDPLEARDEARSALTVAAALDLYVESEAFAAKAKATQSNDRARIKRHLKPTLGREYVDKLTVEQVRRAMRSIREGKTALDEKTGKPRGRARVRGGDMAARDSIGLLRTALNWARTERLTTNNPAADIKLSASPQREAVLTEPEQYRALFDALEALESDGTIRSAAADIFRVLALTGARKSEIAACRWEYVDLRAGTITLPPSAHKTGHATGKPRVIYLPAAAQEIIARQPEGKPGDLVFRPARGANPMALSRPWEHVRTAAKLPRGMGIHGLRHSLATMLAVSGAQAAEIMAAVGHRQMSTTQRYIHFAQNARAALAERAAAPALAGMTNKPGAEVVELKGQK